MNNVFSNLQVRATTKKQYRLIYLAIDAAWRLLVAHSSNLKRIHYSRVGDKPCGHQTATIRWMISDDLFPTFVLVPCRGGQGTYIKKAIALSKREVLARHTYLLSSPWTIRCLRLRPPLRSRGSGRVRITLATPHIYFVCWLFRFIYDLDARCSREVAPTYRKYSSLVQGHSTYHTKKNSLSCRKQKEM